MIAVVDKIRSLLVIAYVLLWADVEEGHLPATCPLLNIPHTLSPFFPLQRINWSHHSSHNQTLPCDSHHPCLHEALVSLLQGLLPGHDSPWAQSIRANFWPCWPCCLSLIALTSQQERPEMDSGTGFLTGLLATGRINFAYGVGEHLFFLQWVMLQEESLFRAPMHMCNGHYIFFIVRTFRQ